MHSCERPCTDSSGRIRGRIPQLFAYSYIHIPCLNSHHCCSRSAIYTPSLNVHRFKVRFIFICYHMQNTCSAFSHAIPTRFFNCCLIEYADILVFRKDWAKSSSFILPKILPTPVHEYVEHVICLLASSLDDYCAEISRMRRGHR